MADNPLDLFAAALSPDQIRQQRIAELQAQGVPTAGVSGAAAQFGGQLGRLIGGRGRDQELQQARINQTILQNASKEAGAQVQQGQDPVIAQVLAMNEAAMKLDQAGSPREAQQLRLQMDQAIQNRRLRNTELLKIQADIGKTEAETAALQAPAAPKESKFSLLEFQNARAQKLAELAALPEGADSSLVIKEIDELNRNIDKLGSPTPGKTEFDVKGTRPTKKTIQDVQESLGNTEAALGRIRTIEQQFDPSFLTFMGKWKQGLRGLQDMAGVEMSREERAGFIRHVAFKQSAVSNLNLYIKEITGAQMSEPEANRLRKAVPDAETDSPEEFRAKMIQSRFMLEAAERRARDMLASAPPGQDPVEWFERSGNGLDNYMDFEGMTQALIGDDPAVAQPATPTDGRVPISDKVQGILNSAAP